MEAEFTNLRDANGGPCLPDDVTFAAWEKQTYLQSGSLLAKSCESALELSGHEDRLKSAAAEFGENVAYARQVIQFCRLVWIVGYLFSSAVFEENVKVLS